MTGTWTAGQLHAYIGRQYLAEAASVIKQVNRWLRRGDGVAIYENQELGHPELGWPRLVSYGSSAAMLETDEPPQRLPDTPTLINWRYRLAATYRGEPLEAGNGRQHGLVEETDRGRADPRRQPGPPGVGESE
jgi:hypothetical protein